MAAVLKDASALPAPPPIHQLHHYAYRARDAEETRRFYEDILGLPLYHIIQSDYVPSTGRVLPLHALLLPAAGRLVHRLLRPRR